MRKPACWNTRAVGLQDTKAMSKSILEILEYDEEVQKRAQWEAFEFALLGDGDVEVTNESHEDADDHTYTIHVEGGIPADCTCPAWEFQPGACKHMVATAIREPVLEAARQDQPVRADGGVSLEEFGVDDHDRPECECDGLPGSFPCWSCVRDGRRNLPGEGE